MSYTREDYIRVFREEPARVGHMVGFPDLKPLHNEWMKEMLYSSEDMTLLAHRLSYKTTCVSVVLAIYIALLPRLSTLFMRKTDTDVKEIILQTQKILTHPQFAYAASVIMGKPLELLTASAYEINTNYNTSTRGTSQLLGIGTGGSVTGKHFDRIFTDDIVNLKDRTSAAERDRTKAIYQELQNVRNHGGRIINTATPWHKDDAVSVLMPNVQRHDCYSTGIMSPELIEEKRRSMTHSLFAANYELKHIAAENALFSTTPQRTEDEKLLYDGIAHVDAAYGGEDFTAFTCARRIGDTIYLYGKLFAAHVDTCKDKIITDCERLRCSPIYCETNADKSYLSRELRRRRMATRPYPETQNKYYKISTYLRKWWDHIVILEGTDPAYIDQILDYTEQAAHDDAPDSAACVCRVLDRRE